MKPASNTKFYIDSNVFFYAKIRDRTYGETCSNVLRKIMAGEFQAAVCSLVPIEVANALVKYGLQREVVEEVRAICSLINEVYAIDIADVQEAAEIYRMVTISPYDCLHAAVMKKYGLKDIISADRDFDKVDWIKRLDPASSSATSP